MTGPTKPPAPPAPTGHRDGPLFPPAQKTDRPLIIAIAIIAALATLTAIGARVAWSAAHAWGERLDQTLTVRVDSMAGLTGPETAAEAAPLIGELPGVASARAIPADELMGMIAPALGVGEVPTQMPLAGLIGVEHTVPDDAVPPLMEAIAATLEAGGFTVSVDDHAAYERSARRFASAMRAGGLALLFASLISAILITAYAVQANMAVRKDVVEVLHIIGAQDAFIANAVTRRFFALGAKAGVGAAAVAGVGVALLTVATMNAAPDDPQHFAPAFTPAWLDAAILLVAPGVTAALSGVAARRAALTHLKEVYV